MSETPELPEIPLAGGCNCEAVRFEVSEPLVGSLICHCKRCQRRTGSAFSVSALTALGSFRFTAGEDSVRSWSAGDGWTKHFCGTCGGHVLTTNPENDGLPRFPERITSYAPPPQ